MQIHPDAPVHGDPGVADPGDGPRNHKESEGGIARLVHLRAHDQTKDPEHVAHQTDQENDLHFQALQEAGNQRGGDG